MDTEEELFVIKSLEELKNKNDINSMGTGIIFYSDISNLSFVSLNTKTDNTLLENNDFVDTINFLSLKSSLYHDGFHFFNINLMKLTHISQFVSPNINISDSKGLANLRPCGAREMTAYFTSLLEGVICVGLLSHNKTIKVYKNGHCVFEE